MSLPLCKMEAMNKENAQSKVKSWLSQTGVDDPPLLKTKPDGKTVVIQHHPTHGKMVARSDELSRKILEVSELIKKTFNDALEQGLPKCPIEGIVYTIYQREPGAAPNDPYAEAQDDEREVEARRQERKRRRRKEKERKEREEREKDRHG